MRSDDEIKARLRAEFPGWSIIRTRQGRWWASQHVTDGQTASAGPDIDFVDTPEELRALLAEATDQMSS